jgi:hypothetical protein
MKPSQTRQAVKATVLLTITALTLACGYSSKTTQPVAGSVPAISALTPASMTAGSSAFTLTVNGTNFGSQAVVNWNGAARTTTFVSGNQVTAAIAAADIATAGSAAVTVTNPGTPGTGMYGSGGTLPETSKPMSFTIN